MIYVDFCTDIPHDDDFTKFDTLSQLHMEDFNHVYHNTTDTAEGKC